MKAHDPSQPTIIEQLSLRKTFLPTIEVMRILGVTRATLCSWVRSGSISAVRIGRESKFDPSVVAQWLTDRSL